MSAPVPAFSIFNTVGLFEVSSWSRVKQTSLPPDKILISRLSSIMSGNESELISRELTSFEARALAINVRASVPVFVIASLI